ncbi:hypothetical protein F4801DRAFT_580732 [Xylaria longipes]|nr:hypothetical protein F4801DRAFT_580732 [Xylaria longipes]RYC60403.1 hypothetical protein CHU98_g5815 [Xylaria longipes]
MAPSFVHYAREARFLTPNANGNVVEGYITVLLLGGLSGFALCFAIVALVILLLSRRDRSKHRNNLDLELGQRHPHQELNNAHSVSAGTTNEELPARAVGTRSVHSYESELDDGFEEVELRGYQTARAVPMTFVQRQESSGDVLRTVEVSSPNNPAVPSTRIAKASRFLEHIDD